METHQWQMKYTPWFSAEEMHETANNWTSKLNFIQDEQLFFKHLLQQLAQSDVTGKNAFSYQNLSEELESLKKDCNLLVSAVLCHQNKLFILLDGIDQIDEEDMYREIHLEISDAIGEFLIKHDQLKKDLFQMGKTQLKNHRNYKQVV